MLSPTWSRLMSSKGVVGWCEGAVYITSPGRPILAYSWAMPAVLVAGRIEGECFYFFCFFSFIPVPLSSLSLSFISSISFLSFSERRHKMTHKGWRVVKPHYNQIMSSKKFYMRLCTLDSHLIIFHGSLFWITVLHSYNLNISSTRMVVSIW